MKNTIKKSMEKFIGKMKARAGLFRDDRAEGHIVAVVVIAVVVIALAAIFNSQITGFVSNMFTKFNDTAQQF